MKKILITGTVLFLIGWFIPAGSMAQDKKNAIELKSSTVDKSRGANPNIKGEMPTTDNPKPKPAKSRGDGLGVCTICMDNYTGYFVKVYVDGYFRGTVDAYGSGCVTVGDGYTTLYCISSGGSREWRFTPGNCSGTMLFNLVE